MQRNHENGGAETGGDQPEGRRADQTRSKRIILRSRSTHKWSLEPDSTHCEWQTPTLSRTKTESPNAIPGPKPTETILHHRPRETATSHAGRAAETDVCEKGNSGESDCVPELCRQRGFPFPGFRAGTTGRRIANGISRGR